jgi:hypothetical protein
MKYSYTTDRWQCCFSFFLLVIFLSYLWRYMKWMSHKNEEIQIFMSIHFTDITVLGTYFCYFNAKIKFGFLQLCPSLNWLLIWFWQINKKQMTETQLHFQLSYQIAWTGVFHGVSTTKSRSISESHETFRVCRA